MLLRVVLFITLLVNVQGLCANDFAQQEEDKRPPQVDLATDEQGPTRIVLEVRDRGINNDPPSDGKSFEHLLNLLKCAMHAPSVYYMNKPDTVAGHRAIYLSQLATVLKCLRDRTRFRENSIDILSDLRLLKVLAGVAYCVDCHDLLKKIDDREVGSEVIMEGPSERIIQTMLLGLEMFFHSLFILNDKKIISSSILNFFKGDLGLESLDMLELMRLWFKIKHHSGLVLTEVEEEDIMEEIEEEIEQQGANVSLEDIQNFNAVSDEKQEGSVEEVVAHS